MTLRIDSDKMKEEHAPEVIALGHLLISGSTTSEAPLPLQRPKTVVGRKNAHITVDDSALSSHHFEIDCSGQGEFTIRDLESTNGTRVNGARIESCALHSGDTIEAGHTTFVFRTLATIAWK